MFQVKTSFNALRRLGVLVCVAGSGKLCLAVFRYFWCAQSA